VPGRAAGTQRHRGALGHRAQAPDERVLEGPLRAGPGLAIRAATVEAGRPLAVPAKTRGPAVALLRGPAKASSALIAGLVLPVLPATEHAGLLGQHQAAQPQAAQPQAAQPQAALRREIRLGVTGPRGAVMTPAGPRVRRVQERLGPVARLLAGRARAGSATPAGHPMAGTSATAGAQPRTGPVGPLEPRQVVSSATPTGRHPGVSSAAASGPLLMTSVTAPGPLPTTTPVAAPDRRGATVTAERRQLLAVAVTAPAPATQPGRRRVTGLAARSGPPRAGRAGPPRGTAHVTGMLGASAGRLGMMIDVTTGPPLLATATGGPVARTGRRRATGLAGRTMLVPALKVAGHRPRTVTGIAETPPAAARGPERAGPVPAIAADLAVKARGQLPRAPRTARPGLRPTARPVLPQTARTGLRLTGPRAVSRTGRLVAPPQIVRLRSVAMMARLRDRPTAREVHRAMAAATAHRGRIADAEMTGRKSDQERGGPSRPARTTGAAREVRLRHTSRVRPARRFPIRSAPTSSTPKRGPN
jgi:hypothetical protein